MLDDANRQRARPPSDHRLSTEDHHAALEAQAIRAAVIYESVRKEGETELMRPARALWWSGVAAGVGMSLSLFAQAVLHEHLPASDWRPLVAAFGYTVGFLAVILGRMQLFTENTLTAVLPVLTRPSWDCLKNLLRLWTVVLVANLSGALLSAWLTSWLGFLPETTLEASKELARAYADKSVGEMFFRGIPAGFLVAVVVWCLPSARNLSFFIIITFTYLIALADLAHVIAGSTDLFLLAISGELGWLSAIFGGIAPSLAGNILGGSGLVALIVHAQVRPEIA
ncbi:MAG: formate/nitrite transporter family protein [Opitutales bacterium]